MPPQSSGSLGLDDEMDEERDPDWPDDWPDEDPARPPAPPGWPTPPPVPGSSRGPRRPLVLAVVALVALAAGAGIALAASRGSPPSAASSTPAPAPSFGGPGQGKAGTGPSGGGPVSQLFVGGKVLKVSSTSISIGGRGPSVTAAVTSATKVTGRVSSIAGVKVGDQVTAQIMPGSSQATVTAIQDPGQLPSSGGLP
jgi:hypothetical protein